jgi:threonine dehydrogenase-like Zn-dependent dehydrogenase
VKAVRSAPPGVEVVDVPDPDDDAGVITVRSASICGSDFGYIAWGSTYVLGHELAGTTTDGAAVCVEAAFSCGRCEWCRQGKVNLCPHMGERVPGMTADGGMAMYFASPPENLVRLPAGLDVRDACLVEPTAVAWHGCRIAGVGPGTRVAVVGGGAIGLLAVAAARALGAPDVALVARHPHQLEAGERLGANTAADGGYDVVVEAAGTESSLAGSVQLVRPEGTVVILGVFSPATPFPYIPALMKEARVLSSICYCRYDGGRDFDDAADLLVREPEIVRTVISHRFPLEHATEAFRVAADKTSGAVRVVIEPWS